MHPISLHFTVSAVPGLSDVHAARSRLLVTWSSNGSLSFAYTELAASSNHDHDVKAEIKLHPRNEGRNSSVVNRDHSEIIYSSRAMQIPNGDDVRPRKVDITVSEASTSVKHIWKSELDCKCIRKTHESVKIKAILGHITKMPCSLKKVLTEHKRKFRFNMKRIRLELIRSIRYVTLRFILDGDDSSKKALWTSNDLLNHLEPSTQAKLKEKRHQFRSVIPTNILLGYIWVKEWGLCMCINIWKDCQP